MHSSTYAFSPFTLALPPSLSHTHTHFSFLSFLGSANIDCAAALHKSRDSCTQWEKGKETGAGGGAAAAARGGAEGAAANAQKQRLSFNYTD